MIQVRVPKVADLHALVVEIERSQILLPKPVPRLSIPYEDEVDVAVLKWIASHVRGVDAVDHHHGRGRGRGCQVFARRSDQRD